MNLIKKRILTGDRPTGPLHLGHFAGSLQNRVKLQHDHETFILIADVQALTDNFQQPEKVQEAVYEVLLDNLAVGLDPKIATIFLQSAILEIAELTIYFANLVTVSRLQRNPTVKTEIKERKFEKSLPLGFFMYPISQAADILCVNANLVPVGEDQLPHIEQTREIARKFNQIYGKTFNEPEALVSKVPRLVGIDGQAKMSKSLGNCIFLKDDPKIIHQKVFAMYTDPNHIHASDPGRIEDNVPFIYLDIFDPNQKELAELKENYQKGGVGDVEVKERLTRILSEFLEPIREKRKKIVKERAHVHEILKAGTQRARQVIQETMQKVREALRLC